MRHRAATEVTITRVCHGARVACFEPATKQIVYGLTHFSFAVWYCKGCYAIMVDFIDREQIEDLQP